MARILVVEDDSQVAQQLKKWLTMEEHAVDLVDDGTKAVQRMTSASFDLIVIDWMLPGSISGVDLLKQFRDAGGRTPVLMLTAKTEVADKMEGLGHGADDYLTKPFYMEELSARVRALLRRPEQFIGTVIKAGDITLDTNDGRITKGDQELKLSAKEFALLEFFMRHPGQIFNAEELLDHVWPTDAEATPLNARVYVSKVRSKIDQPGQPSLIQNVHGVGYKFEAS